MVFLKSPNSKNLSKNAVAKKLAKNSFRVEASFYFKNFWQLLPKRNI